jgi:hypothetical protein
MANTGKNVIPRATPRTQVAATKETSLAGTSEPAPSPADPGVDAIPQYIAEEATTGRIESAELECHADVTRPGRPRRDTVEMPAIAIDALRIASKKRSDDIERATTRRRRTR